ncbi:MAG: substrate-binding domain-containing protein [Pseudomonadota bacterium]
MRNERRLATAILGLCLIATAAPAAPDSGATPPLRVCADPNNLPFSNRAGKGFENELAEMIARELDTEVEYTWWAQRRGFIRNTLNAGECDLVAGVPAGYELVETTRPYYCSTYVFVQPEPRRRQPLRALSDERLRQLTIGVHLVGDDGANPPPAHALGQRGIVDNVVGYMIYGDYRDPNPPARLVEAVNRGHVDVAAVWGPIGGYFARRSEPPLHIEPITGSASVPFRFAIAMGVRKGDTDLRDDIQSILDQRRDDIRVLLLRYDLPLVDDGACADEVSDHD